MKKLKRFYNKSLLEFGSKKWGYESLALLAQTCLGAVAAMLILGNDTAATVQIGELFLVTILAMGFNAAVLVDLRPKPAFNILIGSILFSSAMIVINLN